MPWIVGALAAVASAVFISLTFGRAVVRRMEEASRLSVAVATIGLLLLLIGVEFKVWGPSPEILRPPIHGLGPKIVGFYLGPTQMLALVIASAIGIALAI